MSRHVLWLSHFVPYPPWGGCAQRSYNLLREIARENEIHLVTLANPATHPTREEVDAAVSHLQPMCASVRVFTKPTDTSRLRWWLMALGTFFRRDSYDTRWLRSPAAHGWLASARHRPSIDLVHVDTLGLTQYLAHVSRTPCILNHHNVESDMMRLRAQLETRVAHRIYYHREAAKLERDERAWAPRADMNLVVSQLDEERLRNVVGDVSVAVVENGVDTSYFKPTGRPVQTGRFVFAGGMNAYQNREAVLYFFREVWPLLREDDARRTWTVVGRDPPPELSGAESMGVETTGFVPDPRPLIEEAEIYVCPIQNGGGTRLKILDALAMARPLIATRFSVQGLELTQGEHYLPADSPAEFLQATRRLESDVEFRSRLGRQGRDWVCRRYAWEAIGGRLRTLIDSVVEGARTKRGVQHPVALPAALPTHPVT